MSLAKCHFGSTIASRYNEPSFQAALLQPLVGRKMPTHDVNLDALIEREDFHVQSDDVQRVGRLPGDVKITDLEHSYQGLLRKPDFQRETNSWGPSRIRDFVKSFVDGDFIPAVIMWRSSHSGKSFVIDGAHRLSALMAWVENDYGDGAKSKEFWRNQIPAGQIKLAKATRDLIEQEIGSYRDLKSYLAKPQLAPNDAAVKRARDMNTYTIGLQWVDGTPETAQESFLRINGNAVAIDKTEMAIIRARRKPNAIATRALMNFGTGHRYWSGFSQENQTAIEEQARTIYDSLFTPLLETPIKSTELPLAGQGYSASAFQFILDFVNFVSGITDAMWKQSGKGQSTQAVDGLSDDADGTATLECLENVRKAVALVSGTHPGSLGLHPAVYFYTHTEKVNTTALLATIRFAKELKTNNQFRLFTKHRKDFEEFLVAHRHFGSALSHRFGARNRPVEAVYLLYKTLLEALRDGISDHDSIRERLFAVPSLATLRAAQEQLAAGKRFSRGAKSASFVRASLDSAVRCPNCGARIHSKSMTFDHKVRRSDGGRGDSDNAQPMHPFCNSGDKEARIHEERKTGEPQSTAGV